MTSLIQKQALAHAALDDNVSPVSGGLVPDYEVSDVAGSVAAADKFISTLPSYNYSPSAAEAQMKQSAYPHGFTTTVQYIDTVPWELTFVLALQQELKPLGITVIPKPVSFNAWFGDFFTHKLVGLNLLTLANALVNDPSGIRPTSLARGARTTSPSSRTRPSIMLPTSSTPTSPRKPSAYWAATKVILSQVADQVPYIPLWTEPSPLEAQGLQVHRLLGPVIVPDDHWPMD